MKSVSYKIYELNNWIYRYFSKKGTNERPQKIAWITSFVPFEIFDALDIACVYPESYAAVIAAGGKARACLNEACAKGFSLDCCSYSSCFNGSLSLGTGPRGLPPKPDILVGANNQCGTLSNWWKLLSRQLDVPLILLDYPGERNSGENTKEYVYNQHKNLVCSLETLTHSSIDEGTLLSKIETSRENVKLWMYILDLYAERDVGAALLFDYIAPLVLARSNTASGELYKLIADEIQTSCLRHAENKRIYWLGYPLWYDSKRCPIVDGMQITGSNYSTWWNLNYEGDTVWDMLYNAYNFTSLNVTAYTRREFIKKEFARTKSEGVIINKNKSCKRDYSTMTEFDCPLPCVSIESDMIDSEFFNKPATLDKIELLKSII